MIVSLIICSQTRQEFVADASVVTLVGAGLPKIGYITPVLVFCCALASIGSGLLTTWSAGTRYNHVRWQSLLTSLT